LGSIISQDIRELERIIPHQEHHDEKEYQNTSRHHDHHANTSPRGIPIVSTPAGAKFIIIVSIGGNINTS